METVPSFNVAIAVLWLCGGGVVAMVWRSWQLCVGSSVRLSCGFCVMFMWQWWCGGDVTVVWRSCGGGLT